MLKRKGQESKTKVAREQDIPTQFPPNSQLNMSDGEKVDSDDESAVNRDVSSKGKRVYKTYYTDEELLVEWFQENSILYNKRMKEYKTRTRRLLNGHKDVPGMQNVGENLTVVTRD